MSVTADWGPTNPVDGDAGRPIGSIHALALATWGERAQMRALLEELCEAAAAVARALNEKGPLAAVREELVDVESLRLSLVDVLGTPEEWEADRKRKRRKLARKLGLADPPRSGA